jgi:hypothetical protein
MYNENEKVLYGLMSKCTDTKRKFIFHSITEITKSNVFGAVTRDA